MKTDLFTFEGYLCFTVALYMIGMQILLCIVKIYVMHIEIKLFSTILASCMAKHGGQHWHHSNHIRIRKLYNNM